MTISALLAVALAPAVVLMIYVWSKDRVDKEPFGLLLLLFLLGAVSCVPASLLEGLFSDFYEMIFPDITGYSSVESDGATFVIYEIFHNFLNIALVEEGLKFLFMFFATRKNKNFNSLFDGMIYAVFVSLGFAALENVLYVVEYGFETGVLRAFTAVPGHMFDAVFMGYYYSFWHVSHVTGVFEEHFEKIGLIRIKEPRIKGTKNLVFAIGVPILVHGLYDFTLNIGTTAAVVVFYIFLAILYIICFRRIKYLSKIDTEEYQVVFGALEKKYPGVIEQYNLYLLRLQEQREFSGINIKQ